MGSDQLYKSARVRILRRIVFIIMVLVWLWSCGALRYLIGVPSFVVLAIMIIVPIAALRSSKWKKPIIIFGAILFFVSLVDRKSVV